MKDGARFHILTVGWDRVLVEGLGDRISARSDLRFSHVLHPRMTAADFNGRASLEGLHFFGTATTPMPTADAALLASLEQDGVPTLHNMILGDRVASLLPYDETLKYATFLARRLQALYSEVQPSVVVGAFDALHSGISLAVARRMGIPWQALNFSVIPPGLACFCDQLSPAYRICPGERDPAALRAFAEKALAAFEQRRFKVQAYIAPPPSSAAKALKRLPGRIAAVARTLRDARNRSHLQFTEDRTTFSVLAAIKHLHRSRRAYAASAASLQGHASPPPKPYILFGLHMQPESSIDVWAPFYSNQMWVIELLSRSIPATHRLLVKVHKSDVARYTREDLQQMQSFPGVELVRPFADSVSFVERADMVIAIQGTMGLEAAFLGKPVIMLADSPTTLFPSVAQIGALADLPKLIRHRLAQPAPSRAQIVDAFASYLKPFVPASNNDWTVAKTSSEIDGYVELFTELARYYTPAAEARA